MGSHYWDTFLDINFRANGQRFYTLTGWSYPDWTIGPEFTIDLGQLPHRDRLGISLTATPYLAQHFCVAWNGVPIGTHDAIGPFVASFPIPAGSVSGNRTAVLSIRLTEPKRPSEHSGTDDHRDLGLMIERIEVFGTNAPVRDAWPILHPDVVHAPPDNEALLSYFESLGDNCELGFVQKRLGVTASSLLRFCATPVDQLRLGLANNFMGIDDPNGVTVVENGPDHAREYQIVIPRYGLHYHTLTFTHEAARKAVHDRELSKLFYKHAKFLEGLSQGDRIYVLKQNAPLSPATVWTIWFLLQKWGANTLLWVRQASTDEKPGVVRVIAPGLLEATVQGFADYTDATLGNDQAWIALCKKAIRVVSEARKAESIP